MTHTAFTSRTPLGAVLLSGIVVSCAVSPAASAMSAILVQTPAPNPDARSMAEFTERAAAYAELHRKIEATMPKVPDEATPRAIDTHQRAFAAAMARARAGARQGDVFTADMQQLVRTLLGRLFADAQARRELRSSVMEDNPSGVTIAVNGRYPDSVPLSTMPPDILKQLPKLPEELEYRFVGETLILLDPDAHIIVDFVTRALPR